MPAYSYRDDYAPYVPGSAAPKRSERSRVRAIPGQRPHKETSPLPPTANLVAAVIAIALVFAAIVGVTCIFMSSEAVIAESGSRLLANELTTARHEGRTLEIQASALTNGTSIQDKATAMGMAAPLYESSIVLSPDVVATNADGSLSISESIRIAASLG